MKIKFTIILYFLVNTLTFSQGFLSTQGKAIVNEAGDTIILRGMGLGGWMLQEGYMLQTASFANAQYQIRGKIEELIGDANTQEFYDKWLENHVTKADIDALKEWGFNSVRLPMHYNLFTLPIEEEPVQGQNTWLTRGFEMTDSLIAWCAENEMYVILDLHAAPGGQGYDQGISDYDPNKPSLWESQANRDKMAALWGQLAARYVDEPWVAGYDLLNEPNWNLPGNVLLRSLYVQVINEIREIDQTHIIFIEGNWFANDFTGLTPPFDDNMVYSPHKYWSYNDQGSIQWVLDIRDNYNVPLYLGESGENSNVWFRDAIKLLEDNHIGWAWWPMKKVESISGPLSVIKTPAYQSLLNYWENGGKPPSVGFAKSTLMELAENLKFENCTYQKDVIDAMFRQVYSDETLPFEEHTIPGYIPAVNYDLGIRGEAYEDSDIATYHVSTGNYTAWNNGWSYRNDGVDIEPSTDFQNPTNHNVGFINKGEWMQYTIDVPETAAYDIHVRVATPNTSGRFHFISNGADISRLSYVPVTGGWQNWQTITAPNVILTPENNNIRFYSDGSGFNLSSFEIEEKGPTTAVETIFLSAFTVDDDRIQLNLNKPIEGPVEAAITDFAVFANAAPIEITHVELNPANPRIIFFDLNTNFNHEQVIKVSYTGAQVFAEDETPLNNFFLKDVENRVPIIHSIPGKIEAEDYAAQNGVELENCSDTGGGQNLSFLDGGDYVDYEIDVEQTGTYAVQYRTAAESEIGAIQLLRRNEEDEFLPLHTASFFPTGDWQNWNTTTKNVALLGGRYTLRVLINQGGFNFNWLDFDLVSNSNEIEKDYIFEIFPNPSSTILNLHLEVVGDPPAFVTISNMIGQQMWVNNWATAKKIEQLDVSAWPSGTYVIRLIFENGQTINKTFVHNR